MGAIIPNRSTSRGGAVLSDATRATGSASKLSGLDDRSWLFSAGLQHSEQLRLDTGFREDRSGHDRLHRDLRRSRVLYRTLSISFDLERQQYDMLEVICEDNNRDPYHYGSGNRELAP